MGRRNAYFCARNVVAMILPMSQPIVDSPSPYFPVFFDLREQPVLVVGGGAVAERKLRQLLQAGARPTVAAQRVTRTIAAWIEEERVVHHVGPFLPQLLESTRLAFAATSDRGVNRAVHAAAERLGVPVNVVDDPRYCRFISPAVVNRGVVQVAISTHGASPVLARRLRALFERLLPAGLGRVAEAALRLRGHAQRLLPLAARRRFWEAALTEEAILQLSALDVDEVAAQLTRSLRRFEASEAEAVEGRVHLVGAGPGDPDLLTLRAAQLLAQADVILHDSLVPEAILERARRDADRIAVGKRGGGERFSQLEIHRLMIQEARRGRTVVRLKGGDPFVFGRGGEELAALAAAGISVEVVPGITAAIGCAAAADLPLTHRDHAHTLTFITGQVAAAPGEAPTGVHDWGRLAGPGRTVVVYMAARRAAALRREMLEAGLAPDLPVALVIDGTRPTQQVLRGTVDCLLQLAQRIPAGAVSLMVIGQVAGLGSNLCRTVSSTAARAAA